MLTRFSRKTAAAFGALLAFSIAAALQPASATAAPLPQRIISLTPGITETLYALGLGKRLVGDTNYCDYPPAARLKPHIGDLVVNYEAVLALRPDLVIADAATNRSALGRLRSLRVPLMIVTSDSIQEVEDGIEAVGAATGKPSQATATIAHMEHQLRLTATIARSRAGKPPLRTLVIVGLDPLYLAGSKSFMGDMVQRAGGLDLAGDIAYAPSSKEAAIAERPQAIFCSPDDKAALLNDPAWRTTAAARSGNVFVYSSDAYERPGPRLGDAAFAVATDLARAHRAGS